MSETLRFDVIIIGAGLGGASVAHVLQHTGKRILILERGDFLKQEKENWDITEVSVNKRYDAKETWYDRNGHPFSPRVYYNVGGGTKVFGGSALRFRTQDFASREHDGGSSVGWPFGYEELEPYYARAEELLGVRGVSGEDPTEPPRGAFPLPPVEHEPEIARLASAFARFGVHPIHLPVAIDQGRGGKCQKGSPCDGFPCMVRAKGDAENRLLRPMLLKKPENVTLWTNSLVERLETEEGGKRVTRALVSRAGQRFSVEGDLFIVSAGAVNSAVLLLRSRSPDHPNGLANSSGLVGRFFMSHNNSVILALSPWRRNPTIFQKTLAVHDYYNTGSSTGRPLGTIQLRGKVKPEMLKGKPNPMLRFFPRFIAERSVDLWIMTEDLPDPDNRVELDGDGNIHLKRTPTNLSAHKQLLKKAKALMRRAGYFISFVDKRGVSAIQHQCGTVRFGNDPRTSVLDQWCKAHDLDNLYVIDASFFPSSAAVNPSLTILAQGLRATEHLKQRL